MLQISNRTPFVPLLNVLFDQNGADTLYLAVKGTFTLEPRPEVAAQVPPVLKDVYWGDPAASSLRAASEAHLGKPATEVVLVGNAWSPGGRKVPDLLVSVAVAERRKTVQVFGDRRWKAGGGSCSRAEPFESMPLMFERAFGGVHATDDGRILAAEDRNPVGVGFLGQRAPRQLDSKSLPNLEDPQQPISRAGDRPPPACFGFIAASWLPRRSFAGTYDEEWAQRRAPFLPRDFDPRFFAAASPELTFNRFLAGGEELNILGADRRGPLRSTLPTVRPQAQVRLAGRVHTLRLNLETVVIEPDERRLILTWRDRLVCDKRALRVESVELSLADPPERARAAR